jgi:hypothetical protein
LIALRYFNFTRQEDRQALANLTHADQRLASAVRQEHAEAAQALNLSQRQRGEHLVAPVIDDRWRRHRLP